MGFQDALTKTSKQCHPPIFAHVNVVFCPKDAGRNKPLGWSYWRRCSTCCPTVTLTVDLLYIWFGPLKFWLPVEHFLITCLNLQNLKVSKKLFITCRFDWSYKKTLNFVFYLESAASMEATLFPFNASTHSTWSWRGDLRKPFPKSTCIWICVSSQVTAAIWM